MPKFYLAINIPGTQRRRRGCFLMFGCWFFLTFSFLPAPTHASPQPTLVIRDDPGGSVIERANLIDKYSANGTKVQIRGRFCHSSCTMYLGLQNICVDAGTIFGFHGPSSRLYGLSLSPAAFEHWSGVMARYYPEPIKSWFMKKARHRTVGFHEIRGSELIQMGIPGCGS